MTPPLTAMPPDTSAQPTLMTADEFCRLHQRGRAELVKGIVKELPMPWLRHGAICHQIAFEIGLYVRQHQLGRVMTNDSFIQTRSNPDSVRGMDVCYISYQRLPQGEIPEGLLAVVPELIVEVRSPSDGWSELFAKVAEYLRLGVAAVIILDAASKTASVYRDQEIQQLFSATQELIVPEILPDFRVAVERLFE